MIEATITLKINEGVRREMMLNLDEAMDDIADAILERSQELVPVDEATLKHSGHVEREELDKKIIYDAPHSPYIEFGTRPHWPPFKPVQEWVWRKRHDLGIKDKEVDEVAYQICRKIATQGTEPQPYLRPAVDEIIPKIEAMIRARMK
jgi:hypothetical protein